jgi:hypothetical protein
VTVRPATSASAWGVFPMALVVGVVAGLVAYSGIVAGAAAVAFAAAWKGIGESR